ncbi:hypothetical protein GCM10023231_19910 [Olivibacter ginsenosidimutans]|uniref:Uncharacterized protein n=1 Tax=Olivibacter ginsenosidimutans TaxID=1176537 RepID=A0ABP9B8I0_9SPHI
MKTGMQILLIAYLIRIFLAITSLDSKIPDGRLLRTIDFASDLNKSQWAYGFFKRDINKRLDFQFRIHHNNGLEDTLTTSRGFTFYSPNRECGLRFYNMAGSFLNDSLSQPIMTRSIGVFLLNKVKDADQIDVIANFETYPSLAEHHPGIPKRQKFYDAVVSLNGIKK